jgi:hypothetical protein
MADFRDGSSTEGLRPSISRPLFLAKADAAAPVRRLLATRGWGPRPARDRQERGGGKIEGEARIVVDVNAPKGTRASVDTNNVFKETRLNRSQQMDHGSRHSGPTIDLAIGALDEHLSLAPTERRPDDEVRIVLLRRQGGLRRSGARPAGSRTDSWHWREAPRAGPRIGCQAHIRGRAAILAPAGPARSWGRWSDIGPILDRVNF